MLFMLTFFLKEKLMQKPRLKYLKEPFLSQKIDNWYPCINYYMNLQTYRYFQSLYSVLKKQVVKLIQEDLQGILLDGSTSPANLTKMILFILLQQLEKTCAEKKTHSKNIKRWKRSDASWLKKKDAPSGEYNLKKRVMVLTLDSPGWTHIRGFSWMGPHNG